MTREEWREGITAEEELELFRLVARGKEAEAELKAAEKKESVNLDSAERRRLEAEQEAGAEACSELAVAYRAFADNRARICHWSTGRQFAVDELRSHAMAALFALLRRYQPETGVPFPGYASQPLVREIKRLAYSEGPGPEPPISIGVFEEDAVDDDRGTPVPEPLRSDPTGRQKGEGLSLTEALDSMRRFFDPMLACEGGTAEHRRLIEKIHRSLAPDESLVQLGEWLFKPRGLEHGEKRTRPIDAMEWRLLIGAISQHHVDRPTESTAAGQRERPPAHPSKSGALECRSRRRQFVDGGTLQTVRES
jgi:hypothetical protein